MLCDLQTIFDQLYAYDKNHELGIGELQVESRCKSKWPKFATATATAATYGTGTPNLKERELPVPESCQFRIGGGESHTKVSDFSLSDRLLSNSIFSRNIPVFVSLLQSTELALTPMLLSSGYRDAFSLPSTRLRKPEVD
jgi:hypothetical protein